MKALTLQEFGRMAVVEHPDPRAEDGTVVIAVVATGICGSDIHGYTGENGRRFPGQIMGHETVGHIIEVGGGVDGLAVGDLVTVNPVVIPATDTDEYRGREQHHPDRYVIGVRADLPAAFAERLCVPARNVVRLADDLPPDYGALIEPLAVAVHAVRRVGIAPGQKVLVLGGGPIGQSVVLALIMAGVTDIVVSELDAGRRDLISRLGATAVDPTSSPLVASVEAVFGSLADVTIDAVGISRTLEQALTATRFGGSISLVGMGAPTVELSAFRVSTEERTIVGSFTYSSEDFDDAAHWMSTAPAAASALISEVVSLDDAPAAFARLAHSTTTPGKVLVRFNEGNGDV